MKRLDETYAHILHKMGAQGNYSCTRNQNNFLTNLWLIGYNFYFDIHMIEIISACAKKIVFGHQKWLNSANFAIFQYITNSILYTEFVNSSF